MCVKPLHTPTISKTARFNITVGAAGAGLVVMAGIIWSSAAWMTSVDTKLERLITVAETLVQQAEQRDGVLLQHESRLTRVETKLEDLERRP